MIFLKDKKTLLSFEDNKVNVIQYIPSQDIYQIESKEIIDTTDESQIKKFAEERIYNVDLLIPDKETYLKLLNFPKAQKILKSEIITEIENYIPESVMEDNIYWEKIGQNEGENVVSARVIREEYMKQVLIYLEKAKLKLNKVYFESDVFAKSRVNIEIPEIISIKKSTGELFLVVFKGKVWQSIFAEENKKMEIINQMKYDFEDKWKIKIENVSEENGDVFEMIQDKLKGKDNYTNTVNFLLIAMMVVSIIVLIIFIPMIFKNTKQTQNNLIKIQQINK